MVNFDDRIATYTLDMLNEIDLAYAMTVHKAQGSEYQCVVLAAMPAAPSLMVRGVLYTALTRARELLIVVGGRRGHPGHGGQRPSAAAVFRPPVEAGTLRIRRRDKGRQVCCRWRMGCVPLDAGRAVIFAGWADTPPVSLCERETGGCYPCWTSPCGDTRAAIRRPLRIRPAVMAEFSRWNRRQRFHRTGGATRTHMGPIFYLSSIE